MKPNVIDIELIVHYGTSTNMDLEISQGTMDEDTFNFHILDRDRDHTTGRTTITFNDSNELIEIIKDFNKRFNLIKK